MIVSPTYIAKRTHKGQIIGDATWEPLISVEDHEAIKRLFANPARKVSTGNQPVWLLSGLALCGVCGAKSKVATPRGYPNYMCKVGFHTSRRVNAMDRLVTGVVVDRLTSPDLIEDMAASTTGGEDVMAEAKVLRNRLDAFVDSAASGDLSPAALARIEAKLLPQIAEAERRARASVMSPVVAQFAGEDAAAMFDEADIRVKRSLISALVKIEMMPTPPTRVFRPETVRITFI
jgi:hypothetical protein